MSSSANATTSAASDYSSVPFYGYTQGPGYWGKTFFTWPPDPRVPLTTTYFTSAQIQNLAHQFLRDFGYSANDFNNTAVVARTRLVCVKAGSPGVSRPPTA